MTFTPVYTHSDDPRTGRENPADSLASMGPGSSTIRNRGDIPAEMMPTVFAPFNTPTERRQRAGPVRRDGRRGSLGLGFYIVREIANAHGGGGDAESGNGETAFRLSLPRHAREV